MDPANRSQGVSQQPSRGPLPIENTTPPKQLLGNFLDSKKKAAPCSSSSIEQGGILEHDVAGESRPPP